MKIQKVPPSRKMELLDPIVMFFFVFDFHKTWIFLPLEKHPPVLFCFVLFFFKDFSSSYLHNMKSLSYLIHGVFCGRCGWRCECEILLALEQSAGRILLKWEVTLWSMLGILSLTWYISAKEEIERRVVNWFERRILNWVCFLSWTLNSVHSMKEFRKQFLRRCRVEYKPFSIQMAKLKLSSLKALKWIITISNIHLRDHDDFKESWKKNQHSRNVFITKKHKSLPQRKTYSHPFPCFFQLVPLWKTWHWSSLVNRSGGLWHGAFGWRCSQVIGQGYWPTQVQGAIASSHFLCWKICVPPPKKGSKLQMDIFMWKPKKKGSLFFFLQERVLVLLLFFQIEINRCWVNVKQGHGIIHLLRQASLRIRG